MYYSTVSEILDFQSKLGDNPLFVCDMDGNIMSGYSLPKNVEPNANLFPNGIIPENQAIPFTYRPEELDYYCCSQQVLTGIFAGKTMDARIPAKLVRLINHYNDTGQSFRLTLLTSRKIEEALQILKASGVKNPEKVTLVGDSGATLQIKGELENARPLSLEEQELKDTIEKTVRSESFKQTIADIIAEYTENPHPLYIEVKGIAVNVHYREIIERLQKANRESDAEALNIKLTAYIHKTLTPLVEGTAFELRTGSLTVETIIKDINKGHGLESIVQAAIDAGVDPSSVVFSGDDVCNRKGGSYGAGTDYFAMAAAQKLQTKFGIPIFNIHTHHPENEKPIDGRLMPSQQSDPVNLPVDFPAPRIDLRLPFPWDNAGLISNILDKSHRVNSMVQTCYP